ncbi:hypothetical protein PInf_002654 [Phytophthora infestans]|nr:hypothetical protein PInf_002654 [Phytophthora infestans]
MRPQDRNLSYLVRQMRKKYGSRDNMFRIQQRLAARVQQPGDRLSDYAASLTNIGFGKRIPAESYVEAFINGINNETTATQVRAYESETLDEAAQFAEDKCGEYGEGFKVTEWQPPTFGTDDKIVSGLTKTAKKDPLSLTVLQALLLVSAGLGKENTKTAANKAKAALALEVKTENNAAASNQPRQSQQNGGAGSSGWRNQGNIGNYGNGNYGNGNYGGGGFNGSGNGSGRGFNSNRGFDGGRGLAEAEAEVRT